jgi:hypothetical protein
MQFTVKANDKTLQVRMHKSGKIKQVAAPLCERGDGA